MSTDILPVCDGCGEETQVVAAVINGKFGNYCRHCQIGVRRQHHVGSAQYSRDRDRETHEADMLQPWDHRGNPSKEFIRMYPEESKDMFSEGELKQYG